jgi:hypothetical protein
MKAQLVCDALTMAIWQRQPDKGLLFIQTKVFSTQAINIDNYLLLIVLLAV